MDGQPRRVAPGADADGVRIVAAPGVRRLVWIVACAGGLVALAVAVAVLVIRREPPRAAPDVAAPPSPTAGAAAVVPGTPSPPPLARAAHPRRIARAEASAPPPAAPVSPRPAQPELRYQDIPFPPGERTGIGVFPPPGTEPIKRGIVVPDDFELPDGYVRHYQTTDDGQRLEAVLMFHPDFEWVDDQGAKLALPEDGLVPPDMAPPGLPIRILEVPAEPGTADTP
jgi:hypothetical protein